MMALPNRIFLSPHPDDIAYSCYGSVVNPPAPRDGGYLIVTVFTVSGTAAGLQGQNKSQEEITLIRRAEDEGFARSEGCRFIALGFPDSNVRKEPISGQQTTIEDVSKHSIFQSVKNSIAEIIRPAIGQASIYVPLGIRGHVDHRMVRDAAKQILAESEVPGALSSLIFYEDLPYAAFITEHQIKRLAKDCISPAVRSYEVSLKGMWHRKKKALQMYKSQCLPFTLKTLGDYGLSLGNDPTCRMERLWVADPSAVVPKADIMAWVTWEAARRNGDYTTLFKHIFENPKLQNMVGRTVLMGPMHTPTSFPEYDRLEDIQSIASTLDCYILYPLSLSSSPSGLSKRIHAMLNDVEKRHGISIFYLRDRGNHHSHQVDRILFNFSRALDHKNGAMPTLPLLLQDMKQEVNLSVDMDIRRHPPVMEALSIAEDDRIDLLSTDTNIEACWKKSRSFSDASLHVYQDSNSVYGMLLALPASECLRGIMQSDETAVLVATDELSLPATYATQLDREKYSSRNSPTIKTLFYSGDVHPIRNLATGVVTPQVLTLDSISGFDFEGPIRSLINLSMKKGRTDSHHLLHRAPVPSRYFLSFQPLRHMQNHTSMRIMQKAWRADALAATSANARDELVFLDPAFATKGDIRILSPGVDLISCEPNTKELCRRRLVAYARSVWGYEDLVAEKTIIATQIGRPGAPKAFVRTVRLLQVLASMLSRHGLGEVKLLLIIVTGWDEQRRARTGDYPVIDELMSELQGTSSSSMDNLRVKVVNQPRWPVVPESNLGSTALTREDLHRATDVSICLSLYDSFGVAALEPMSCGAISVVSTGCGCSRKIIELECWKENVIIADYAEDWVREMVKEGEIASEEQLNAHFDITREQKVLLESSTHYKLSLQLLKMLPLNAEQRSRKIESGRRLVSKMNWEDQFVVPFEGLIGGLFDRETQAGD